MAKRADHQRPTVPFGATPAEQPASVREWANRAVWNDRMLDALHHGVRGGKWHTLIDKVYSAVNLDAASETVLDNEGAAGVDHQTVERFGARKHEEIRRLGEELRSGKYQPHAVKRVWIPKPGSTEERPLGIPCVRDRVVQTALRNVLEPIFDVTFAEHSYGFRAGRGCHHALERVEMLLKEGFVYVVDADLKSYFDTIPKDRLLSRVRERVSDSRVLRLVEQFLEQGVMDGLSAWTPTTGTPQGAVIAPPTILQTRVDSWIDGLPEASYVRGMAKAGRARKAWRTTVAKSSIFPGARTWKVVQSRLTRQCRPR